MHFRKSFPNILDLYSSKKKGFNIVNIGRFSKRKIYYEQHRKTGTMYMRSEGILLNFNRGK
jgi:hypothetical protein